MKKTTPINNDEPKTSEIKAYGIECPEGAVPIRRTTKEDLIRAKSFTKARNDSNVSNNFGQQHAILRLDNGYQQFYGVNGEFTTAHIIIVGSGKNEQLNNIQVGLAVHPHVLGDHLTRMFIYWTLLLR